MSRHADNSERNERRKEQHEDVPTVVACRGYFWWRSLLLELLRLPLGSPAAAPFGCTNAIRRNIGAKNCLWVTSARRFAYCGYYVTPDRSDRLLCVSAVSGYWVRMAIDQWVSGTSEDRHTHSSYGRDLSLDSDAPPTSCASTGTAIAPPTLPRRAEATSASSTASCRSDWPVWFSRTVRLLFCARQRAAGTFKPVADATRRVRSSTHAGLGLVSAGPLTA